MDFVQCKYLSMFFSFQIDILQTESRKRLESESDIKKSQEKIVEELHAREQKVLEQVRELKQDKQRLEDTIYRLKTEAMATNVSQQKMKEELEKEREALVRLATVNYAKKSDDNIAVECMYVYGVFSPRGNSRHDGRAGFGRGLL